MAERALPRLTRLLGIVTYLEDHGATPFADLAQHFGVSVVQIRKDLGTLWVSGLPGHMPDHLIDFDAWAYDDDIAHLTNSQGVTQIRLSPREAVALVGALSTMVAAGGAPRAATTALAKLRAVLGGDPIRVVADGSPSPEVAESIADAAARGRVVEIDYVDAMDHRTRRAIEPHRIVTVDGVAYVECWCRRASDYRSFRLDRMDGVVVTGEPISAPPADAETFALEPRFDARLVVARASRWALDDLPGATLTDRGEYVEAVVPVAHTAWIAGRLLAVAPDLRSVEPPALSDEVARQAAAVLAVHGG